MKYLSYVFACAIVLLSFFSSGLVAQAAAPEWVAVGTSINIPRSSVFLRTAGINNTIYLQTFDINSAVSHFIGYDLNTNTYSEKSLSGATTEGNGLCACGFVSDLVPVNNKLYYFANGEFPVSGPPVLSGYSYDTQLNTWSQPAYPHPLGEGGAGVLGNDIYYVGGRELSNDYTNSVNVFNTTTNTWRAVANFPYPVSQSAVTAYNGKLYVFGGESQNMANRNAVHVYDSAANTWTQLPNSPSNIIFPQKAATFNNKIYVLAQSHVYIYDPVTTIWDTNVIAPPDGVDLFGNQFAGPMAINDGLYIVGFDNNLNQYAVFRLNVDSTPTPPPFVPTQAAIPPANSICSNIGPTVKNLVFITHGWEDSAEANKNTDPTSSNYSWVLRAAAAIQAKLPNSTWGVCSYDWHADANTGPFNPKAAYFNAQNQGLTVGLNLTQRHFDSVHMIAHSAGSELIQTAANIVKSHNPNTKIQLTFLDAYDPFDGGSNYGRMTSGNGVQVRADWWAEQYVDTRNAGFGFGDLNLGHTNLILPTSYNFDVTALDNRTFPVGGAASAVDAVSFVHGWPHEWYINSINSGVIKYGFNTSVESGKANVPYLDFMPGDTPCVMTSNDQVCQSSLSKGFNLINVTNIEAVTIVDNSVSNSGTTQQLGQTGLALTTGSPVWMIINKSTTQPENALSFNYQFTSAPGAQGVLTVFVDGEETYKIDERLATAGTNSVTNIPVGNLQPGAHTIEFRLDPFTTVHSSIQINNIQLSQVTLTRVIDTIPPVISITSPTDTQVITASEFTFTVDAADDVGVTNVTYWASGISLSVSEAPFSFTAPIDASYNGTYTAVAVATDAAGNVATSSPVSFTVNIGTSTAVDTTPPIISITSPTSTQVVTANPFTLSVDASDDVGVTSVTYWANGISLPVFEAPFSYSAPLDPTYNGTYTVEAVATDAAGNVATSSPVSFTVAIGTQDELPIQDTFTGTDGTALTNHTADSGAGWTYECCGTSVLLGNKIKGPDWTYSIMYNTFTPTSADYNVSMDVYWNKANAGGMNLMGVAGRVRENIDRYAAYYDATTQNWTLSARSEMNEVVVATSSMPYVQGQTHNVKLGMVGSAITVYVDDVPVISVTDTTLTNSGSPGFVISSLWDPEQMLGDNYLVTDGN